MDDLLTATEAADELNCTPRTVRRRCADGRLTATKLGDTWVIPRRAVEEYEESAGHRSELVPA